MTDTSEARFPVTTDPPVRAVPDPAPTGGDQRPDGSGGPGGRDGGSTATPPVAPPVALDERRARRAARPGPTTDAADFDALYRAEWAGLVALGWSLTGIWSAAEELAQDAFADAFRRWDDVGCLDRPGAWVRRAVVNRAASHHRHRAVERSGLARLDARTATEHGADGDRTGDAAADRVGDPAFWAAVRSLPERQAACVALHYLEDRSVADIAEVLDCRPATVKVHLHRGRAALAGRLAAPVPPTRPDPPTNRRTTTDETGEDAR